MKFTKYSLTLGLLRINNITLIFYLKIDYLQLWFILKNGLKFISKLPFGVGNWTLNKINRELLESAVASLIFPG